MANNERTSITYEMLLTKPNDTEKLPHITDFHYLAFIRDPISRQATYIDMQAMVPTATLTAIETEITNGKFPQYELTCYQIKSVDKSNEDNSNIQKKLYSNFVVIISINKQKDNISTDRPSAEGSIPVRMLLVDPVAWQMRLNTGYNRVFTPDPSENPCLLALETIINNSFNPQINVSKMISFTDYIIKKYAGESKNIKQFVLANKNSLNTTCYGQITVPPTLPEINIPEYLINTYKPFSTPSFWFFDTFNFGNYDNASESETGKIPIWCLLINFFGCLETFKKIDVSEDPTIMTFTHLLGSAPFVDSMGVLNRPNSVVSFISPNMTQVTEKLGNLPSVTTLNNTAEKQTERTTSLKVYYPDSLQSAKSRIVDCMKMFREVVDRIEYYETTNTSPEWLQFGKLYNLEKDQTTGINTNKYIHTPICIVNIFKRMHLKDNTMDCITKYAMLRLVNTSKNG